jgi:hypothetical protein
MTRVPAKAAKDPKRKLKSFSSGDNPAVAEMAPERVDAIESCKCVDRRYAKLRIYATVTGCLKSLEQKGRGLIASAQPCSRAMIRFVTGVSPKQCLLRLNAECFRERRRRFFRPKAFFRHI